jgi:hypothetical protein
VATTEEITKAISAHGLWKTRLKTAIDTRTIETPVETIRQDNQCAFGKWLYGPTLTSADKSSDHYKTVITLHAEFHKAAARVAELAVSGKATEAEASIAPGGEYATVSAKLTRVMMEWKTALQ